jgi:D-alanyl-D-alanine carboxypeptidase
VVEAVSGERWADYVQRQIFEPLGMGASSVDRDVPELVVGYGRRMPDGSREALPFVDARGMAAATGITSTVADMAKFVSAQFPHHGAALPRILSTGSLREMHRVRSVENDWLSGNGIGFAVTRVRGRTYVGHGGGYPGYRTQTLIQLDDRIGVVVLSNALDADPEAIARRLMATVGAAVAKISAPPPTAAPWDPSWSRFAGTYRGSWNDLQVVLQNERLVLIALNGHVGDEIAPIALEPLGGGRFRHAAPNGLGPVGEVVRFVEDHGRVTRMVLGDGFLECLPEGSLLATVAPRG